MRTIAIVSQKGGAGKTTLAVHLAVAAAASGRVTLLLDADAQATASRWAQWREGKEPEVIDCGAPSLLAGKLAAAQKLGAEVAIIDTPPHADLMARQAAKLADLVLIPCRPKAFDLAAIEATAELVKATGTPSFVIFNGGPPRAPLVYREAAELIESDGAAGLGLKMVPIILPERAAFHHSTAEGRTAGETAQGSKADAEIKALWSWISEQLNLFTRPHGASAERAA